MSVTKDNYDSTVQQVDDVESNNKIIEIKEKDDDNVIVPDDGLRKAAIIGNTSGICLLILFFAHMSGYITAQLFLIGNTIYQIGIMISSYIYWSTRRSRIGYARSRQVILIAILLYSHVIYPCYNQYISC